MQFRSRRFIQKPMCFTLSGYDKLRRVFLYIRLALQHALHGFLAREALAWRGHASLP